MTIDEKVRVLTNIFSKIDLNNESDKNLVFSYIESTVNIKTKLSIKNECKKVCDCN